MRPNACPHPLREATMSFLQCVPERFPKPLLRLFPSPAHWRCVMAQVPPPWQNRILCELANRLVLPALTAEARQFLEGRALSVEVEDLGLQWGFTLHGTRLQPLPAGRTPEAIIRGRALDLLLLASQLEDADTLFFQRRLVMTGDTALGLQTRNLLDQLPREHLAPGLRILVNRLTRLAQAAHDARRT